MILEIAAVAAVVALAYEGLARHWSDFKGKAVAPPAPPAKPGDLPTPKPQPPTPDNPPAIDLGQPGPAEGSIEQWQIRKALAWEADAAALNRWAVAASKMNWAPAMKLLLEKMKAVIANPQPYAYLQTDYPNYMVTDPEGNSTPIVLDTPDEQTTGIAKYLLANELDMGNLANAVDFYASKGYPSTSAMFKRKLIAQKAMREGVGASLPPLVRDGQTGVILPTSIQPMPNPVQLFSSPAFMRAHRVAGLGRQNRLRAPHNRNNGSR